MSLKPGQVNLGTSIMAVKFDGGVVLGADSRTTMGSYVVNRVTDKLTPLHEQIYCCRSGAASDTQAIADIVRLQLSQHSVDVGRAPTVKTAASLLQRICYEYKDRLLAGIIVAGYDELSGGTVYNIPLGGACVEQDYAIGGSGSSFIYGYCDANYRKGMDEKECIAFVTRALEHAMYRDGSSGGCVRTLVITGKKVERSYLQNDLLAVPPLPPKELRI